MSANMTERTVLPGEPTQRMADLLTVLMAHGRHEQSWPQIDALPPNALAPFAETRVVLELAWGGDSLNDDNPDAPVRVAMQCSCRPGGQPGLFDVAGTCPARSSTILRLPVLDDRAGVGGACQSNQVWPAS